MVDCVFCKIARHEIPKEFSYEDKDLMVFPDINPAKDVHILIVPKKHMEDFMDLSDSKLMIKILNKAKDVLKKEKLDKRGFRVLFNGGGAQVIDHLHFHIVGPIGKAFRI